MPEITMDLLRSSLPLASLDANEGGAVAEAINKSRAPIRIHFLKLHREEGIKHAKEGFALAERPEGNDRRPFNQNIEQTAHAYSSRLSDIVRRSSMQT